MQQHLVLEKQTTTFCQSEPLLLQIKTTNFSAQFHLWTYLGTYSNCSHFRIIYFLCRQNLGLFIGIWVLFISKCLIHIKFFITYLSRFKLICLVWIKPIQVTDWWLNNKHNNFDYCGMFSSTVVNVSKSQTLLWKPWL